MEHRLPCASATFRRAAGQDGCPRRRADANRRARWRYPNRRPGRTTLSARGVSRITTSQPDCKQRFALNIMKRGRLPEAPCNTSSLAVASKTGRTRVTASASWRRAGSSRPRAPPGLAGAAGPAAIRAGNSGLSRSRHACAACSAPRPTTEGHCASDACSLALPVPRHRHHRFIPRSCVRQVLSIVFGVHSPRRDYSGRAQRRHPWRPSTAPLPATR